MTAPGDFTAGDVLQASDMNALPAGIVVAGSRTTSFTATAGYQTVLSVSFTADSTRLYRLNFVVSNAMGTPSSRMQMQFIDDLSSIKGRGYQGGLTYGTIINYATLTTFTTGSRTLNLQAYRDGGTIADFYADTTSPMRLWVEDLGLA